MRRAVPLLLLLLSTWTVPGAAMDVTTCGQVVAPREAGVLTQDLDCSGLPASDGVVLGNGSSLDMQGHAIVSGPGSVGVRCKFGEVRCKDGKFGPVCVGPTGRCRVFSSVGSGAVSGAGTGIVSDHDVILDDLVITTSAGGAFAYPRGKLVATNVAAASSSGTSAGFSASKMTLVDVVSSGYQVGIDAGILADRPGQLRGTNVTVSANSEVGVWASKARITGLTATGNGSPLADGPLGGGVLGSRLVLVDSNVVGNLFRGLPGDLVTGRVPRLRNTTCGRSVQLTSDLSFGTWGVCTDD